MIKKFAKYFAGTLAVLAAIAFSLNSGPAQGSAHMSSDGYVMVPMDMNHWDIVKQPQRSEDYPEAQVAFASAGDVPLDYNKNEALPSGSSPAGTYYGESNAVWVRGASIFVKDLDNFTDGIIEYDVLLQRPEAGFIAALVRAVDDGNHERFFMRPHHNNDEDAIQYTPVYNQLQSWQLYTGPLYNNYFTYSYEEWLHCKIVVSGNSAEWFIGDMTKPAQYVPDMKREITDDAGRLGLFALNPDRLGGLFANFKYKQMDKPTLMNSGVELPTAPAGNINSWDRTDPFDEAVLSGKTMLMPSDDAAFTWTNFDADRIGIFAIHKLYTPLKGKNSVFLKKEIMSDSDQIKVLELGYSDRVSVFLNGELQYMGDNTYRSRNRAFLGTAGYYDKVALPLKEGKNELRLAVSAEALFTASWGGMVKFSDTDGISFEGMEPTS